MGVGERILGEVAEELSGHLGESVLLWEGEGGGQRDGVDQGLAVESRQVFFCVFLHG